MRQKCNNVASHSPPHRARARRLDAGLMRAPARAPCSLASLNAQPELATARDAAAWLVSNVRADVVVETLPTNHETGEPALSYLMNALRAGMHVVSGDGVTVCWALLKLQSLHEHGDAAQADKVRQPGQAARVCVRA